MYRIYKKTENGFSVIDDITYEELSIETNLPFMNGDLIDFDEDSPIKYKMVNMFEALLAQRILRMSKQGSPEWLKAKESIDKVRTNHTWLEGDMLLQFLANRKALFEENE